MEFRLLGPVELWSEGQQRELGTPKERCVLAILLLSARQPVTAETLIDRLWDTAPPAKPRQNLYPYIARLRDRLAPFDDVELKSRSRGYVLEVEDAAIDVRRFHLLRAQARAIHDSGDDEHALRLHRAAAQLWRAEPLVDLSGEWVLRTRSSLEDQLLAATFERVNIELRLGLHADLVGELSDLVARYPYNEQLAERLMVALFRCGRQAEALEIFRRVRARLVDEIGTEAGPDLQEVHQRILQGDPTLLVAPHTRLGTGQPPNTLPRDIHTFTGRQLEIRQLLKGLPHQRLTPKAPSAGVNIITIDGMPGVGKTALAIRLAHELAEHYPDGQLYLHLHAHDRGKEPVDPAVALDALLRNLGVPPGRIPQTMDDRTALWRAQLARSRTLIVLDDASGRDQVLPLLPGSPGCLTIVTSRRKLVGLDDVRSQSLGVLPLEDAVTLFTNTVGISRPLDNKDVAAVVQSCGRLPLAIQIAGSRLRHRAAWTVADLLTRLEHNNRRLDELRAEDSEVSAVFEMSYRGLSPRQQLAFRLFGLHPGPDFTAHTAAAFICSTAIEAERILEDLLERHLINEPVQGRFRFHDLLQSYARRLADDDSDHERREAVHRILDYYLSSADSADRQLYPHRRRIDIDVLHPAPAPPPIHTKPQAQSWLAAETDNLLNIAGYAARHGWSTHAAHFAHVLAEYLESRGYWADAAVLHVRAVTAWEGIGDPYGVAQALSDLSLVRFRSGRYNDALEHAEKALAIYRSVLNRSGEAEILDHIGVISWHQSRFSDALTYCRMALKIWRSMKDRRGTARGLDHSAIYLEYLGHYGEAGDNRRRALAIYSEVGDLHGQQMALNNMGDLQLRLGQADAAREYYEEAVALTSEMGRQHEAIWLCNMANIYQQTGRYDDALEGYRKALSTYQEIGDRRNEIETLIGIGSTFQLKKRHSEALVHHERALDISRDIAERYEETKALRCIGATLLSSDRYALALDHYKEAFSLAKSISEPFEQAKALEGMGDALLHMQEPTQANKLWKQALKKYEKLGVREARTLQSYLKEN